MNQTVLERIFELLSESRAAICDDCIAAALGLSRRQHANAECNRLAASGRIVRANEICSQCGRRKLTNQLRDGVLDSRSAAPSKPLTVNPSPPEVKISLEGPTITIMEYTFTRVCAVEPDRDDAGRVQLYTPRMEDAETQGLRLHRYGEGPFCRFRVPSRMEVEGVYMIVVNDHIAYIGRCDRFSLRFNMGYGQISARNCYNGGQPTNYRINRLIYEEVSTGSQLFVWFLQTVESGTVESFLIRSLKPPWNATLRG